jgi:hypothetical protein
MGSCTQPVDGLQVSLVHSSLSLQSGAAPPVHVPLWQVSVVVQALASLHVVPSAATTGLEHAPVAGSQTLTWHWSGAEHWIGLPPVQVPAWHVSDCVQPLPSLQVVPSVTATGLEHVPVAGSQALTWHWSGAVHWIGLPPVQVPAWHVSVCVQALPSLQLVPSLAFGLEHVPVAGLHTPATWH